jgi:hypothetical protein
MRVFLASLKGEADRYRKSSQQIDDIHRDLDISFEGLEMAAATKVFQLRRPRTVIQNREQLPNARVPHSARPQHTDAQPQTARAGARVRHTEAQTARGRRPSAVAQPPGLWITTSDALVLDRVEPVQDLIHGSSHHFLADLPFEIPERPKTARVQKPPFIERRVASGTEEIRVHGCHITGMSELRFRSE